MEKVFAVIGNLKRETNDFILLGTGFFIENNGTFVTAGHVFRKNIDTIQEFYICFPENEEFVDITPVIEYKFYSRQLYLDEERRLKTPRKRQNYQCGPEFIDVCVGKINPIETNFFNFKIKRPNIGEKLSMPCFNINKTVIKGKFFNLTNGKVDSRFIETYNRNLKFEDRLKLARIPFLYETMVFQNIDLYNNCIEVYGEATKGNSGSPVLNEKGEVIGIYVSGANFCDLGAVLLSRYVKRKSNKLNNKIRHGK